jgi:hypothetical protein
VSGLDRFVSKDAALTMPITTYQVLLREAALDERDRIIKLLEAEGVKQQTGLDSPEWHLSEIIALIKGENK